MQCELLASRDSIGTITCSQPSLTSEQLMSNDRPSGDAQADNACSKQAEPLAAHDAIIAEARAKLKNLREQLEVAEAALDDSDLRIDGCDKASNATTEAHSALNDLLQFFGSDQVWISLPEATDEIHRLRHNLATQLANLTAELTDLRPKLPPATWPSRLRHKKLHEDVQQLIGQVKAVEAVLPAVSFRLALEQPATSASDLPDSSVPTSFSPLPPRNPRSTESTPEREQFDVLKFAQLLLKLTAMQNSARRNNLIIYLSEAPRNMQGFNRDPNNDLEDVILITRRVRQFPHGLTELIKYLSIFDKDTNDMLAVEYYLSLTTE